MMNRKRKNDFENENYTRKKQKTEHITYEYKIQDLIQELNQFSQRIENKFCNIEKRLQKIEEYLKEKNEVPYYIN
jgi:hypothetical protein